MLLKIFHDHWIIIIKNNDYSNVEYRIKKSKCKI